MLNGQNTARKLSHKESKTESSMKPQYSAISEHSLVKGTPDDIEAWLMSLVGDSHVSPSQSQENNKPKMMNEICGMQQSQSFVKYNQDTASWKMSQGCLPGLMDTSDTYLESWPRAGMMLDGECYQQPKWERRIKEIGYGYWLTPSTIQIKPSKERRESRKNMREKTNRKDSPGCLEEQVMTRKFWPTPCARDWKGTAGGFQKDVDLPGQVKNYPTPRARDWKGKNTKEGLIRKDGKSRMDQLCNMVAYGGTKTPPKGHLNPEWVEWLMGWPIGHTELKPLEMDKYLLWRRKHGCY